MRLEKESFNYLLLTATYLPFYLLLSNSAYRNKTTNYEFK